MKKTGVIVCNFASFDKTVINNYGIIPIVSNLIWEEENLLEGDNVFQKMRDAHKKGIKSSPKTSQPSLGTFKKCFEGALKENEKVICITISSKISGTYNAAIQAKKLLKNEQKEKIYIIDSNNIDAAETLLAIKAVEIIKAENDINEAIAVIKSYIPKTYFYGMTENPDQMEAGGRTTHLLALALKQMQKIGMRPILHMDDGVVKAANLRMNASDIAGALFNQFEDLNKNKLKEGKLFRIAISHADNIIGAEKLKDLFESSYKSQIKIDFISMTGVFIGAHVGPGTLMCAVLED